MLWRVIWGSRGKMEKTMKATTMLFGPVSRDLNEGYYKWAIEKTMDTAISYLQIFNV